jgi:putative transposase
MNLVLSATSKKKAVITLLSRKIKAEDVKQPDKTGKATAVDINVGHFDYTGGRVNVLSKKLDRIYKKIKHYQRQLAKKRVQNGAAAC